MQWCIAYAVKLMDGQINLADEKRQIEKLI